VHTFRDLAALSSDEILSRLKAAGQPAPSKSDCDAWINQAQKHLATAKSSAKTKSETKQTSERTNSPAASKVWKPFATFVVEYQGLTVEGETEQRRTKVHHLETDTDKNWPGIVSVELCHWMLEQTDEIASPEVEQIIEENRARAQRALEQEVEEKRAVALRELEQTLADDQTHARQVLQQELDTEGTQARKELEQERIQAQIDLEQELVEKRAQAKLELKQQLEEERTQAQQLVEQELDDKRTQAELELKQQLEEERTQAQQLIEQELDRRRAQAELELKQQLEEEHSQALQELDQEKPVEVDPQTITEPEPSEKEPQPLPDEEIPSAVQPFEPQPVVSEPRVELEISKLQAFQPAEATEPVGIGLPGQPFSGYISSSELFAFTVDFDLIEATTNPDELVEQGITYHVQFYAHNISTGSKDLLGSTKAAIFVEGRTSYNPKLTDITLDCGIYELSAVLMTIQNGHPIVNYIMVVPLLQVS
jgi:hypothetical protein